MNDASRSAARLRNAHEEAMPNAGLVFPENASEHADGERRGVLRSDERRATSDTQQSVLERRVLLCYSGQ